MTIKYVDLISKFHLSSLDPNDPDQPQLPKNPGLANRHHLILAVLPKKVFAHAKKSFAKSFIFQKFAGAQNGQEDVQQSEK